MTRAPIRLFFDKLASPIGDLLLATDEAGVLRALDFEEYEERMRRILRRQYGEVILEPGPAPETVTGPIRRYFAGDLRRFARGPLEDHRHGVPAVGVGGPDQIPPGQTLSYGALAGEDRRADGGAGRGPGQRRQPDSARGALPPGDRRRRLPDRLRRRPAPEALAASARRGGVRGQGGGLTRSAHRDRSRVDLAFPGRLERFYLARLPSRSRTASAIR